MSQDWTSGKGICRNSELPHRFHISLLHALAIEHTATCNWHNVDFQETTRAFKALARVMMSPGIRNGLSHQFMPYFLN